jgi:cation diffusion facilitator family transporter
VQEGSKRAIFAAFLANLGIAISKFVGFLFTGSASMLAESVHSLADTGNQALLLLGGRKSRREATDLHPFGYGRERYFWSFVVALVLFSLGGLFAIYEGIHKLEHAADSKIEGGAINLGILGVAVLLESLSFRTAIREANPLRKGQSWLRFLRRAKTPELPVVLIEDLGALLGLSIALSALILAQVTGDAVWDGIGTLSIGVLLFTLAAFLAFEMKGLLIGEAADPDIQRKIVDAIEGDPDVKQLIYVRTQHLGPDEVLLAAKVEFTATLAGRALADTIDRVEASVRKVAPVAKQIYLEPDVGRNDHQ